MPPWQWRESPPRRPPCSARPCRGRNSRPARLGSPPQHSAKPCDSNPRVRRRQLRSPTRTAGLSHASRVGAARGDMARLASQRGQLAGPARPHSPRNCRHDSRPGGGRGGARQRARREYGAFGPRPPRRRGISASANSPASHSDRRRLGADHGPIWLVRDRRGHREQMILDWDYNAWGGKYPPFTQDDAVPARVGELLGIPVRSPGMVLEGGSIDVNGAGTLLTTESCLLNPNRNPRLSRAEIEAALRDWLGVRQILWLGDGIAGDDTDGHVDDLTRFVAPGTVVTVLEENPRDPNFEPLRANLARLQAMRLEDGAPLRVVPLPMPDPVEYEGQRLPASYANFYIANRAVLLPVFGCAQDERAQRILAALFPGRMVVPIPARDLVWGLGACHCLTQQQPAAAADISHGSSPAPAFQ